MNCHEELYLDWYGPRKKPPAGILLLLWHNEEEQYYFGIYDDAKKEFKVDVRMREAGTKQAYFPRKEVQWFDFPAPRSF